MMMPSSPGKRSDTENTAVCGGGNPTTFFFIMKKTKERIQERPKYMNEQIMTLILAVFASSGFWAFLTNVVQKPQIKEVLDEVNKMNTKVENLSYQLEEQKAITSRTRILRFDDELYNNMKHSKEYFEQILEDIKTYEFFCRDHPKFENNKAVEAIKHIRGIYDECWKEHKFA